METQLTSPTEWMPALSKTYGAILRKFHLEMGALTVENVSAYLATLATHARPATVRTVKFALQASAVAMVKDAGAREAVRSAFRQIKTPKPDATIHGEKVLTAEQMESLATVNASARARLLVKVLSVTGARISEALGMRFSDCDVRGDVVSVRIVGKGKKERRVFLPVELYQEARAVYGGKTFLFETSNGKAVHHSAGRRMVYAVGKASGLPRLHPHAFRHSWATAQLKAGRTLKAVSKYLGHSTVAITATFYDHNELSPVEALGFT